MLKDAQHGKGGGGAGSNQYEKKRDSVQRAPSPYKEALESAGISPDQGKRYLRQFDRLTNHLQL